MNVYDFEDYREFLKKAFLKKKQSAPSLSKRLVSAKIGFKSPAHFSLVLVNRLNLSLKYIESVAQYFALTPQESQYFYFLVLYNQAKVESKKLEYYEEICKRRKVPKSSVHQDQYEYFQHWYNAAIREALQVIDFSKNYKKLASFIYPPISPEQAESAIKLLLRLDLIARSDEGFFKCKDSFVSTGDNRTAQALKDYVNQMLQLAQESQSKFPAREKNHSSLTVSIDSKTYNDIVNELRHSRSKIIGLVNTCKTPERVYQINMNIFPVSKRKRK